MRSARPLADPEPDHARHHHHAVGVSRADIVADVDYLQADAPRHGRDDAGIAEVDLRLLHRDLRIDGLRVADASIFPTIVSGHTVSEGDYSLWALLTFL